MKTQTYTPDLSNQPTLADDSGALDATMASPNSVQGAAAAGATGGVRTTVLPRIEWAGNAPTIVSTSRPRFETTRALGSGGLGEVVAAKDLDIGREVAIKRLRADARSAGSLARFVDEIRTVGALEHPNILPIHDVGADEQGALYFVMPRVRGETLEAIIERLQAGDAATHAHWTFERRAHVFRQLLDAVAFAHERGYVHRDIKPSNVMIGPYGEVFLMDWGIAKPVNAPDHAAAAKHDQPAPHAGRVTETHAGAVIGTPAYMSPEQARGEPVDARSDVYSLCVLFDELLCLRHYLDDCKTVDEMLQGVQHVQHSLASFVPNRHQAPAPADLAWFARKGVAKDPAQRYQSVREMIDRLDARDEGIIPIQCHLTFTKRVTGTWMRFIDRHPMLFTVALSLLVLGGIGAAVWQGVR
ncbi:MAG TPA: serine/threonine-protein kinase [Polyangiaceae bacterium]|nr:serine/threonine-protein kinase [Polyangiaceae bacterium]